MPTEGSSESDAADGLDSAIAEYLRAVEAGTPPVREDFLTLHDRFRPELAAFLENRERMERLTAGLRAEAAFPDFGDYCGLEEIGRGGMGVVCRAFKPSLKRVVALKMLLAGPFAGPAGLARFKTEAEASARLQHPNIVQIYDVGGHEGRPYLCLEYVAGGSLAQRLDGTPRPARAAAELVATVARAVQHAHERGVLHRDIKPANILLTSDGVPKIADFGLAKQLGPDAAAEPATRTGDVLGTVSYMSPEQAAGDRRKAGPATDIYSLGAVLYELLTGRPPFRADSLVMTLKLVLDGEPVPPGVPNPGLDPDLAAVCMKCLEKNPSDRYPSAAALAEDLESWLAGRPVAARARTVMERLSRTLEYAPDVAEFVSAGGGLLVLAVWVAAGHTGAFLLNRAGRPPTAVLAAAFSAYIGLAAVFLRLARRRATPAAEPERRQQMVWGAHLLAVVAVTAALIQIQGPESPELVPTFYPCLAALTGMAYFIAGSLFWGHYYLFGLAFFALAVVMPIRPEWAPLEYALLALATTAAIGFRLRRAASEKPGRPR